MAHLTAEHLCKRNPNFYLQNDFYLKVHTPLFIVASNWKQLKQPSIDQQINKLRHAMKWTSKNKTEMNCIYIPQDGYASKILKWKKLE